ncbi:MAG: hypothetical protein GX937_01890, partial [Lentisphaerae bacterium]|nr:hypothetical protein [Lentisphaerota bacterium]
QWFAVQAQFQDFQLLARPGLHLFYDPLETCKRHIHAVPSEIIVLLQALKAMNAMEITEAGGLNQQRERLRQRQDLHQIMPVGIF